MTKATGKFMEKDFFDLDEVASMIATKYKVVFDRMDVYDLILKGRLDLTQRLSQLAAFRCQIVSEAEISIHIPNYDSKLALSVPGEMLSKVFGLEKPFFFELDTGDFLDAIILADGRIGAFYKDFEILSGLYDLLVYPSDIDRDFGSFNWKEYWGPYVLVKPSNPIYSDHIYCLRKYLDRREYSDGYIYGSRFELPNEAASYLPDCSRIVMNSSLEKFFSSELDKKIVGVTRGENLNPREKNTLLNIIAALKSLLIQSDNSARKSGQFASQNALIKALQTTFPNKGGLRTRTLEEKFADAKKQFDE
jgi:hypothetical protein